MRRILFAAGLLALGLAPLSAQDKTSPAAEPLSVEKLVEQLGDRNFRVREAAAKILEERGDASLPALRKAFDAAGSAETRRRLQALISNMERVAALAPKRITLKASNRPLPDVLAAITRQTGYPIQMQGNAGLNLTLDLENVTFWQTMDRICLDCNLVLHHNDGQTMQLYQQDSTWPFVSYQGPFKVMADNFNYNRQARLGGFQRNPIHNDIRSETLNFGFNIQSEPKLPMMQIGQARLIEAIDDRGNSMKMPANIHEARYFDSHFNSYRSHNQSGNIQLAPPVSGAKTVKLLRINVPVTVLAVQRPEIVFDDITKVKNKKIAGSTAEILVEEVIADPKNKATCQIKMNVRNLAPNAAQDYAWTRSVNQRVELFDAKGNKYIAQGYSDNNTSPANVKATFVFGTQGDAAIGPPARLVFNHWGLLNHNVEFEFRDLPLP